MFKNAVSIENKSLTTDIGIDTFKIFLQGKIKDNAIDNLLDYTSCPYNQEKNKMQYTTTKGRDLKVSSIKLRENKKYQCNFKGVNNLALQYSVPKINNKPLELLDIKGNKQAYDFILNEVSQFLDFDLRDVKVSRLDLTKNIEVNNSVSDYLSLFSLLPRTKALNFQTSHTQYNKRFATCAYDKMQEVQSNKNYSKKEKKELSEFYQDKNILRLEVRLLEASKIKDDSKLLNLDLQDPKTYLEQDKFLKVCNDLYIGNYAKKLFKYSEKTIPIAKKEAINTVLELRAKGFKGNQILQVTSHLLNLLNLDTFASLIYPQSKQARYQEKKRIKRLLDLIKIKSQDLILFDDLLNELKEKVFIKNIA